MPEVRAWEAPSEPPERFEGGADRTRRRAGRVILATRFIMAPFYLGLLVWLCLLAVKFVQKLVVFTTGILSMSENEAILAGLSLIDFALVANLVLVVIYAAWRHMVGPILDNDVKHLSIAAVGTEFTDVKLKLVTSIVVIASVQILESFVHIADITRHEALWRLAILLGLATTGGLLAAIDWLKAESR